MEPARRPKLLLVVFAVCTVVPFAGDFPEADAATPFRIEVADAPGLVGSHTSLALDANGDPHVSYSAPAVGDARYATRKLGVWSTETIESGVVGLFTSIALAPDGTPHALYFDSFLEVLRHAERTADGWVPETVDGAASVGTFNSLAIGSDGTLHASYYDETSGDLKYARKPGAFWQIETVDTAGRVGRYTSIALDSQGDPHIAYYDSTNTLLKYARKSASGWTIRNIDNAADVGAHASLALTANDIPVISYLDATNLQLKLATGLSPNLTIEVVDAAGNVGQHNSLALTADGEPRISYYELTFGELRYAAKSFGGWSIEVVDVDGDAGLYTSLALDANDVPYISYFENDDDDLRFADAGVHLEEPLGGEFWPAGSGQTVRWRGAGAVDLELTLDGGLTWQPIAQQVSGGSLPVTVPDADSETARLRVTRSSFFSRSESPGFFTIARGLVTPWWHTGADTSEDVGLFSSLELDAHGQPWISYKDAGLDDLRLITRSGSGWTIDVVDTTGDVGENSSLALDPEGNPRIAYYDRTNGDLKYAAWSGGAWTIEVVDTTGDVGRYASLALDGLGRVHVSYFDDTNDDLKYALRDGAWTVETVDATGFVGANGSLAVDSRGQPHVVYREGFSGDAVRYAVKRSGVWSFETVDSDGDAIGFSNSLRLDSEDRPHVGYGESCQLCPGGTSARYARRDGGAWSTEIVESGGEVGSGIALALEADGTPHLTYRSGPGFGAGDLVHARRSVARWHRSVVEAGSGGGSGGDFFGTSLELDADENPRVSYFDAANGDLRYASAAVEIGEPAPGTAWPVGASRTVTWDGNGPVDLSLSTDGGASWRLLAAGLAGGEHRIVVPHAPGKFTQLRVERAVPHSVGITPGFFDLETDIALLNLAAILRTEGAGVEISWDTDPGPEDLAGYRLEQAEAGGWATLVGLTSATRHVDAAGGPGSRYRLFGVNGLGDALLLGEVGVATAAPLAAWPSPYRGGAMTISFAVFGQVGTFAGSARVDLYDLAGRRVATIADGAFEGGRASVTWDGTDAAGRRVPPGVYFLRLRSAGLDEDLKVVVLP